MCGWTVLLTNLPRASFTPADVQVLAWVRWQVELLIKRFKSLGDVNQTRGHLVGRVQCELSARLLGCVVLLRGPVAQWCSVERCGLLASGQAGSSCGAFVASVVGQPSPLASGVTRVATHVETAQTDNTTHHTLLGNY